MNIPARSDGSARTVDVATMRETAALLLGPDDAPGTFVPAPTDVGAITATLRGHLQWLIPEAEAAAGRLRRDSIPRYCAAACVGEARRRLQVQPGQGEHGAVAYARRLARVVRALCDHYEQMAPS